MNKNILKIRYTSTNLRIDEYNLWINNILRWQNSDFNISIVLLDIQNLLQTEREKLKKDFSFNIIRDLFALGINFNKVNILLQSQLPEIQELITYLQYTDLLINKSAGRFISEESNVNLFSEIATMMIFGSDIILVEKDEMKKIELVRDFIGKFNNAFKKKLKLPQSFISNHPRLVGLDGIIVLLDNNCLLFSDNEINARKKIATAVTDSGSVIKFDIKKKPYISNLINLYQLLTAKTYDEIENEFSGKKYFEFKNIIIEKLGEFLKLNFIKSDVKSNQAIKKLLLESNKRTEKKTRKNLEIFKKIAKFPEF